MNIKTETICTGSGVIDTLAEMYIQLRPSPIHPAFRTTGSDSYCVVETPVGSTGVVTLYDRKDFENFVRIMGYKGKPVDIPPTMGAIFLDGVRRNDVMALLGVGAVKKDPFIILSVGPYSRVSAESAGMPEDEWIDVSHKIRFNHELTHFIMRRLFPDRIDAIIDELVADAVGIYAALNRGDDDLAKKFLGITGDIYTGGRLENYVEDGNVESILPEVLRMLDTIREMSLSFTGDPFDLAVELTDRLHAMRS